MALSCQMQHQVGIGLTDRVFRVLGISKIHPQQLVAPLSRWPQRLQDLLDTGEIACVTALVEVEHLGVGIG